MTREEAIEVIKRTKGAMVYTEKEKEALETLIPELAESEDEKIMSRIIDGFKNYSRSASKWNNIPVEEVIAYLEKQKECVSNNFDDIWNEEDCEEIIAEGQKLTPRFKELLKEVCHAWYDRGAKLEKQKETGIQWLKSDNVKNPDKPYIDNAGMFYTTDGRMCYVSEIEKQKGETLRDFIDNFPYSAEQEEQKPVKLSDDELQRHQDELYNFKVFAAKQAKEYHISFVHDFEWNNFCEGLLFYFNEKQKPAGWSEEDESMRDLAIEWAETMSGQFSFVDMNPTDFRKIIAWLKSFPERFSLQPKQEWSEKDEKMRERLITGLTWITYNTRTDSTSPNITFFDEINWLKSLHPQYHGDVTMTEAYKMGKEAGEASHWRPTEHQMTILKAVKNYVGKGSGYWGEGLGSLIDDLEKLGVKEEPEYYQHFDPNC